MSQIVDVDAEAVRVLRASYPRCMTRFVGVDNLQHLCDEYTSHQTKHFCLIHKILEREPAHSESDCDLCRIGAR